MAQGSTLNFKTDCALQASGIHTFHIHFNHIKKFPKRFHFLGKGGYKRECEMDSFSQAK